MMSHHKPYLETQPRPQFPDEVPLDGLQVAQELPGKHLCVNLLLIAALQALVCLFVQTKIRPRS